MIGYTCCRYEPRLTFSKLFRKILRRFLILGKSHENIQQSINLELGNNKAIGLIIIINTLCVKLDVIT